MTLQEWIKAGKQDHVDMKRRAQELKDKLRAMGDLNKKSDDSWTWGKS